MSLHCTIRSIEPLLHFEVLSLWVRLNMELGPATDTCIHQKGTRTRSETLSVLFLEEEGEGAADVAGLQSRADLL